MAVELMTQVEQMAVVDGVRLDSVSNILVGERVAKLPFARARGKLYVIVEPLGDRTGWGALSHEIAQTIHDEYYDSGGSVTAGLRRAMERANQLLCDMNAAESRRSPRLAGVSAVVLKGADLFVAQTGPALVYVFHAGTTVRFPEDSPWLEMSPRRAMEEGYAPPLGLRPELSVDLFHHEVEAGDTLVLAESSVASTLDEEEAAILFGSEEDAANEARMQALFREKDVSLVVVRVGDADEAPAEPRHLQRLTPLSAQPVAERTTSIPRPVRAEVPATPREAVRSAGEWLTWGAAKIAEVGSVVWRRMLPGSDRLRRARALRRRPAGMSLGLQESRTPKDDRLVLAGMLVGLVLVGAAVYGVIRWQAGRMEVSRYHRTLEAVQAKLVEAGQAPDQAAARTALLEADVLLDRASAMSLAGADAEELSRQLGEQLDEIDNVVRLYWLPVLRQYNEPGSQPVRVLSHGIDLYVLDTGLGRVYKYLFNSMTDGLQELGEDVPEVLLRTGDVRSDVTVGRLVDMAWMPAGEGHDWASLLVLDENGVLLEYEPSSGIKVLAAGPRAAASEARKISGIEGRLLLLDAGADQVLVYGPGSGSYDADGLPYTNADLMLSGVVDMAVDGDVYLLYADGLVTKLRAGEQVPFEMTGLDTRLSNPTSMCVTPATSPDNPGYIYIADAGNQRIVQLTKDGQYVRQFKPKRGDESFAELTGVYVDEEAGKMEILAGGALLLANLPQ